MIDLCCLLVAVRAAGPIMVASHWAVRPGVTTLRVVVTAAPMRTARVMLVWSGEMAIDSILDSVASSVRCVGEVKISGECGHERKKPGMMLDAIAAVAAVIVTSLGFSGDQQTADEE